MTENGDIQNLQRRCPRLGGPVAFVYCRTAADGRNPCFKVFDCWWERFDVVGYFQRRLSAEAFRRLSSARPPDKTSSLVELIRQARERINSNIA